MNATDWTVPGEGESALTLWLWLSLPREQTPRADMQVRTALRIARDGPPTEYDRIRCAEALSRVGVLVPAAVGAGR